MTGRLRAYSLWLRARTAISPGSRSFSPGRGTGDPARAGIVVAALLRKLRARDRTHAAVLAFEQGLLGRA